MNGIFERIRKASPVERKALIAEHIGAMARSFEMEIFVLQNRYGGLNPREEESMRAIFNAKMHALATLNERRHR